MVVPAVQLHMNFVDGMLDKTIRKKVNQYGKDIMLFACDLAKADSKRPERRRIVYDIRRFIETDNFTIQPKVILPVNGNELMERYNLKPGPKIGAMVEYIKELMFENPNISKEEVFEKIDEINRTNPIKWTRIKDIERELVKSSTAYVLNGAVPIITIDYMDVLKTDQ